MSEIIDAEHARHDRLAAALIDPHGAEVHIATLLSRWLSDREVTALVGWIGRACDERTARCRDLIARVVAGLGEADRDEHGNRIVTIGPTLARHLLDSITPEEREE
jgi:hypothetical protein